MCGGANTTVEWIGGVDYIVECLSLYYILGGRDLYAPCIGCNSDSLGVSNVMELPSFQHCIRSLHFMHSC